MDRKTIAQFGKRRKKKNRKDADDPVPQHGGLPGQRDPDGEDPRAAHAAPAGPGHRVHRPLAGQHALHGDRAHHSRLFADDRRLGHAHRRRRIRYGAQSVARQHDGQLQRSGQQVGPLGQRSHRLRRRRRGHRRPIRLQGHRPADDQPVLRGVDRPRRLRAAHDDRIDHHVPVHGRVRLRTLLRRPILRPLPTGRRLGLRRHVRLGHDR